MRYSPATDEYDHPELTAVSVDGQMGLHGEVVTAATSQPSREIVPLSVRQHYTDTYQPEPKVRLVHSASGY